MGMLGGFGGVLGVVGSVVGAVGAAHAASAARDSKNFQAAVAQNNAQFAEWQAQDALDRGAYSEYVKRLQTRQLIGTQRATMGARGIDLTVGTAVDIQSDTEFMGNIDALVLRNNAAREAFSYRREAMGLSATAKNLRSEANAISPGMAFGTSLLGGLTGMGSSFFGMGQSTGGSK